VRRFLGLAGLLLSTAGCFGHLAITVQQQIDPRPILPGATLQQEIAVEADGLLGAAARQAMTQSTQTSANAAGGWQLRDNSDATTVRLRMFRSVALDANGSQVQSNLSGDPGKVQTVSDDWFVVRRYRVQIDVSAPENAVAPPASDPQSQQLAELVLAGISYDHYLRMPGFITSTNGTRSDDGRIAWHVSFASAATQQTLAAESVYVDIPRLGAALVAILALAAWRFVASRRRAAAPAPPA
jgi:hypothetical protein